MGVPTVQARGHAGAAMFMRLTPGCATLAGLNLESMDFWRIRRKSKSEAFRRANETRQGRKRAAEAEESSRMDMTYIYLLCTCHI